jgi:hypothetical protein
MVIGLLASAAFPRTNSFARVCAVQKSITLPSALASSKSSAMAKPFVQAPPRPSAQRTSQEPGPRLRR